MQSTGLEDGPMRDRHGAIALEPEEMALLQECFDRILKSRSLDRLSPEANASRQLYSLPTSAASPTRCN